MTLAVSLAFALTNSTPAIAEEQPIIDQIREAALNSWAEKPGDYIAFEEALRETGGDSVTVVMHTIPEAHAFNVTSAEAQQAIEDLQVEPGPANLPTDTFAISATWFHVSHATGEWWEFVGSWQYRDGWLGFNTPDNTSGIAASIPSCWQWDYDQVAAYDPHGQSNPDVYREQSSPTTSVWQVRDQGLPVARADNGMHLLSFTRISTGCTGENLSANYYYEHAQGGGSFTNVSISLSILSVSYSSSPDTLQKDTGQVHTN